MEHSISIAYLGPIGTYSDEAAHALATRLGSAADYVECPTFHDIFDTVANGDVEYGVVATENSLEGPVTATLDDFSARDDVEILGEQILDIHHCLLMHPDASLAEIETVASHPQGIAQCRRFIREEMPGRNILTTSSTSESVRLAMADRRIAGIASEHAAELYGAKVVKRDIADHLGDQTAFALIARKGHAAVFAGSEMKTSLALYLESDRPGALLMILSEFAYAGISLTKIQSRPTKRGLGDYMFFVDIAGSIDDASVAIALDCLRLKLRQVKVLGSYPAA